MSTVKHSMNHSTEFTKSKKTKTSSHSRPLLSNEVELSGLSFSPMKVTNNGRKLVYVNMNNRHFQVETPWLKSSFGIRPPAPEYADPQNPKYSISFSLDGQDGSDPNVKEFSDMIHRVEKKMIRAGVENGMEWFRRKALSEECVEEAMFTKMIKPTMDRKTGEESTVYGPTLTASVPYYDGEWQCQMYTNKREEITEDIAQVVTGRMKVRAILECCPMWFMGSKYGCKWKVKQLEYTPLASSVSLKDYAFDTTIPRHVNVSTLRFSDVKIREPNNAKTVYINNSDGGPLMIQTPWMACYNGISLPLPEYADPERPKYTVLWSLVGHNDVNSDVYLFTQFLQNLEDCILKEAQLHSMEWFRKKSVSTEVLRSAMFNAMVKFRTDKDTGEELLDQPPSFKTSLPFYDNAFKCTLYNEDKVAFTENLDDHAGGKIHARAIIKLNNIWFNSSSFGCKWSVMQMEYRKQNVSKMTEYTFRVPSEITTPVTTTTDESQCVTRDDVESSDNECVDSDLE